MVNPDRAAERRYAQRHHYFWLPCPLCGQEFGGHEWKANGVDGHEASIPTEVTATGAMADGICEDCARAGKGCIAWATAEAAHWIKPHPCQYLPPGLLQSGSQTQMSGLESGSESRWPGAIELPVGDSEWMECGDTPTRVRFDVSHGDDPRPRRDATQSPVLDRASDGGTSWRSRLRGS